MHLAEIGLRDGFNADDLFWYAAGITSILVLVALLVKPAKTIRRFFHRISVFLGDWFGEPADPHRGLQPIPGVMARLKRVEDDVAAQPSLREMVTKLAHEVAELARQVAGIDARIDALHHDTATRETQTQIADKLDDVLDNRDT
jgi:hypothetical protein